MRCQLNYNVLDVILNYVLNLFVLGKEYIICISLVNTPMSLNLIGEFNIYHLKYYT